MRWQENYSAGLPVASVASTTDNELGCKVLVVTKCWVCCCWVFCWEGWMLRLSTKFKSVWEKGTIIGGCGPPRPSSKAEVGVKVALEVGGSEGCPLPGTWPPWRPWSGVWNPPPEFGPLNSQDVLAPLLLPGFISVEPFEPGDNWLSSKNLQAL